MAKLHGLAENPPMTPSLPADQALALSDAIAERAPLFATREAVRLAHLAPIAGLTLDDYNGWLLLTDYRGRDRPGLQAAAEAALDALGERRLSARGAVVKRRPENLSHRGGSEDATPETLAGDRPPRRFTVAEGGMRFAVSFEEAGFGTGLFPDMAEGRAAVRSLGATCPDVLNLFSYTGAFSIAAAVGGSQRILEVDTARKWLGWAQANQRLNGLPNGRVRQRCEDAVQYLAKQGAGRFDLIICDPPSYANPKRGRRFTIERGYREMAAHFARVLRPGGWLVACCNHARTPRGRFRRWVERGLRFERWIPMPPDFRGADYLKVALLRRGD